MPKKPITLDAHSGENLDEAKSTTAVVVQDERGKRVRAALDATFDSLRLSAQRVVHAGLLLREIKDSLEHGEWGTWTRENLYPDKSEEEFKKFAPNIWRWMKTAEGACQLIGLKPEKKFTCDGVKLSMSDLFDVDEEGLSDTAKKAKQKLLTISQENSAHQIFLAVRNQKQIANNNGGPKKKKTKAQLLKEKVITLEAHASGAISSLDLLADNGGEDLSYLEDETLDDLMRVALLIKKQIEKVKKTKKN